jgi:hypothetical protein
VTDNQWLKETARPVSRPQVDASAPNVARVWDYLTGGRDNFDADRRAARQLIRAAPAMERAGHACRAFVGRVTRYLIEEAGTSQFLDVGTGIPSAGSVHEVAQSIAPESRVVCVDNDPVVLSHARAMLRPAPGGATSFVDADVRDPGRIIGQARGTLNFGQPVAIIMDRLLNRVGRDSEVRAILTALLGAVPGGSHLVVVHPASDLDSSMIEAAHRWNRISATTQVMLRAKAELAAWFGDLDIVDPGVVPVTDWRPDPPGDARPPDDESPAVVPMYAVVGRKPPSQPRYSP